MNQDEIDPDIEMYKKFYQNLINNVVHTLNCICPSCIYQYWKRLPENKNTKIDKDNFFFAFLVFATSKFNPKKRGSFDINWEEVKRITNDVMGKKYIDKFEDIALEIHRIFYRYKMIVNAAILKKGNHFDAFLENPQPIIARLVLEKMYHDEKIQDNFESKVKSYIGNKKKVTHKELYKRFSNRRKKHLFPILRRLEYGGKISWESKKITYIEKK